MTTTRLTLQGKVAHERNQRVFAELLRDPNNAVCADCRSPGPCWASYNLGIFLCMRCAGVHRKIGTHVTKVKSLTLDSWTPEQIENLKKHGNKHVNAYFNPQPEKHPIPHGEKEMEKYIRDKYQRKAFMNKETVQKKMENPQVLSQSSSFLAKLRELGFTDNTRNEQALAKANNNVEMAIHLLNSAPIPPASQPALARSITYSEGTIQQPSSYRRPVPLRRNTTTQPIPDILDPNMFENRGSSLLNQTIAMNPIQQQQQQPFNPMLHANINQVNNSPVTQNLLTHNGSPQIQDYTPSGISFSTQNGYYSNQPVYTNTMQSQSDQFKHQINKGYIMSLYNSSSGPIYNRTQESSMATLNNFIPGSLQTNTGSSQHGFMQTGSQSIGNNSHQQNPNISQQANSQQSGDWWN